MRRVSIDQYEFDVIDAEQSLDMAFSSIRQHADLLSFTAACGASHGGAQAPADWPRWRDVSEYVRRFAGVELPPLADCRALILSDIWNDLELVVQTNDQLIWYHWWTTA
jgi:hypothetical protein